VKDALDNVSLLIDEDKPASSYDAHDLLQAEDTELLQGNLSIVNAEIQRANTHLTEWNSILQGALAEAQGFANEVQARGAWTSAKAQVWNGYFASAGAYAQAAQTYLASAQGYASEVQARLQVDSTEYGWYQSQQAKLQADYDRGIQIMRGA
jgi:NAD-dependent oxidoreductase involved in siderophore biosynthesis